ncbi:hypothetical protein [Bacteroides acidifaciens]|uniref:hypothetical protein n=1 Tax=Bacteroides acidifaciens TaxID=85831 RepID=UPI0025B469EE|nr:hypothetical protein [Bacteroides acidifaciens]
MSTTVYNISLKGYVGDRNFYRSDVDVLLTENDGKQVNVSNYDLYELRSSFNTIRAHSGR